jgi:hypothetical protein
MDLHVDITGQLLITSSALIRYWGKNGTVHQLFINFQETHDSVPTAILHNILIHSELFSFSLVYGRN